MLWSCYVHALYFRKTRVNYVIYIECVVASAVLCIEAERSASVVSFYKSPCWWVKMMVQIFLLCSLCVEAVCASGWDQAPSLYKAAGHCCMQHFVEFHTTTTGVDYSRIHFMKSVQTTDASMGCFSFITVTLLTCIPSIHWMLGMHGMQQLYHPLPVSSLVWDAAESGIK